jgi:hypothetical protein
MNFNIIDENFDFKLLIDDDGNITNWPVIKPIIQSFYDDRIIYQIRMGESNTSDVVLKPINITPLTISSKIINIKDDANKIIFEGNFSIKFEVNPRTGKIINGFYLPKMKDKTNKIVILLDSGRNLYVNIKKKALINILEVF